MSPPHLDNSVLHSACEPPQSEITYSTSSRASLLAFYCQSRPRRSSTAVHSLHTSNDPRQDPETDDDCNWPKKNECASKPCLPYRNHSCTHIIIAQLLPLTRRTPRDPHHFQLRKPGSGGVARETSHEPPITPLISYDLYMPNLPDRSPNLDYNLRELAGTRTGPRRQPLFCSHYLCTSMTLFYPFALAGAGVFRHHHHHHHKRRRIRGGVVTIVYYTGDPLWVSEEVRWGVNLSGRVVSFGRRWR